MAEASLSRLLELTAGLTDSAHRAEARELIQHLAQELNVSLPDGAPESHEVHEAQEVHHEAHHEAHHEEPHHHETHHHETHHHEPHPAVGKVEKKEERPVVKEERKVEKKEAPQHAQVKKEVRRTASAPPRTPQSSSGPTGNADCDISSPDIKNAYDQVRDDSAPTNWMLLGYGSSKKVLELYGTGSGGLQEFVSNLKSDEVTYGYLRVIYGDSQRSKFVFVTYVPEGLSGMNRAKANMHKPALIQFLKYMHIEVYATSTSELDEGTIQGKLKAAAGANYGTSTIGGVAAPGSEDYSSIKDQARNFFQQTEAKGDKKGIVYNKGPLSDTTPVTLTGRAGITEKYIKT